MVIRVLNENGNIFAVGRAWFILLKLIPFQSNQPAAYKSRDDPILIQNFNNHYPDLSNEAYKVFLPQGGHKIFVKNCRVVLRRSDTFSCQCMYIHTSNKDITHLHLTCTRLTYNLYATCIIYAYNLPTTDTNYFQYFSTS